MALRALAQKYGPAAVGTYAGVTTFFFTSIYATLSFGYDATPLVLGAVDAAAGIVDLRPWLADIGALDSGGAPTDKLRHGSTFVTTMIVTKLFVPVKLPLAAALTPRVARLMARWRGGPKAR
mmetsp:Transcript_24483/g.76509  ORF Transcript_24483/g.76509 Transcript_24483/m.76509 type:complete len:122 (+) Transcript_24483:206-571(+)